MVTFIVYDNVFGSSRQYIARITGRAPKFTFAREFVGRKSGRRNEVTEYTTDETGLYEDCDISRKGAKEIGYTIVAANAAGGLVKVRADLADAMVIAKRFDAGETLEEIVGIEPPDAAGKVTYFLRTKAEVQQAVSAATVESATEACWQVVQALPEREAKKVVASKAFILALISSSALPEREAKKVVAALKLRVSPKPATPAAETNAEPQEEN